MSLDDDDDVLLLSGEPRAVVSGNGEHNPDGPGEEEELEPGEEGTFDMRLFTSTFHKKRGIGSQSIRKGQKDFESHGTRAQDNALEASRVVIQEVLGYTRLHLDDWIKGWYFPEYWPLTLNQMATAGGGDGGVKIEGVRPDFVANALDPSLHVRDRVVVVEDMKGPLSKGMGRTIRGLKNPMPAIGKIWLLPEEALFMLERGSLDLWWPDCDLGTLMPSTKSEMDDGSACQPGTDGDHAGRQTQREKQQPQQQQAAQGSRGSESERTDVEDHGGEDDDDDDEFANGLPLSLQAAYAFLIGTEGERGKTTLPKYQVYAHLRRSGYFVLRAPLTEPPTESRTRSGPQEDEMDAERRHEEQSADADAEAESRTETKTKGSSLSPTRENVQVACGNSVATRAQPQPEQQSQTQTKKQPMLWQWLLSLVGWQPPPSPLGPLVQPGLYRKYSPIYKQLELLQRFTPLPEPECPSSEAEEPFKVFFHVWRPSKHPVFTKSDPPPPDFRIAVVDARDSCVPSLEQLTALFDSTPFDPPSGSQMEGPGRLYQRMKHGYRNMLVAIVDRGIVNFMRFGQGAFGEEKLFERFDAPARGNRGGKRGGRGRGRGRGRGGSGNTRRR